jgi:hypothetical protein
MSIYIQCRYEFKETGQDTWEMEPLYPVPFRVVSEMIYLILEG